MRLQVLFLAVGLLCCPLIWQVPLRWRARVMMLTTLVVFSIIAPLSVLLMLSVAAIQWLIWKNDYFGYWKVGVIVTILLPIVPMVFYKTAYQFHHGIIPLGLSYYAFRQVHAAFECYKGVMRKPSFAEYGQYLLFLPVILVGPIHRMPEFERSLRRQKWNASLFSEGLERILYGLVKVNFLGNFLFNFKLTELGLHTHHLALRLYLEIVGFTCNAYCQFAGYSDMAIGLGLVWGIRVMENFNAPFLATNMQEFWQRWHISLSSWCRDYVFQPLAALTRNRWLALVLAMLVLALWHEISIRYILWGSLQATLILLTVRCRTWMPTASKFINYHPLGRWVGRIWVFHLFAFSCVVIGYESMGSLRNSFNQLFW
jgi:alginate O-acetyltransferase complex protein AlgI